jgi:hypothetical protein
MTAQWVKLDLQLRVDLLIWRWLIWRWNQLRAQCICFTSTKVQILTQNARLVRENLGWGLGSFDQTRRPQYIWRDLAQRNKRLV